MIQWRNNFTKCTILVIIFPFLIPGSRESKPPQLLADSDLLIEPHHYVAYFSVTLSQIVKEEEKKRTCSFSSNILLQGEPRGPARPRERLPWQHLMAESNVPSLWVCEIHTYEHTSFCLTSEPSDLSLAADLMRRLSFAISDTPRSSHTCRFSYPPAPPPLPQSKRPARRGGGGG